MGPAQLYARRAPLVTRREGTDRSLDRDEERGKPRRMKGLWVIRTQSMLNAECSRGSAEGERDRLLAREPKAHQPTLDGEVDQNADAE